MGDRCAVFDRLHIQTGCLQSGNCAFAATARSFYPHVDFLYSEFGSFFCCSLRCGLTRKWRALTTALEPTCSSTGPAQGFALGVRDGNRGVVKSRVNVSDAEGHISPDSTFFCFCHSIGFSWELQKYVIQVVCNILSGFVLELFRRKIELLEILNTLFAGDCFLGAFSRAGIGFGSLAANG